MTVRTPSSSSSAAAAAAAAEAAAKAAAEAAARAAAEARAEAQREAQRAAAEQERQAAQAAAQKAAAAKDKVEPASESVRRGLSQDAVGRKDPLAAPAAQTTDAPGVAEVTGSRKSLAGRGPSAGVEGFRGAERSAETRVDAEEKTALARDAQQTLKSARGDVVAAQQEVTAAKKAVRSEQQDPFAPANPLLPAPTAGTQRLEAAEQKLSDATAQEKTADAAAARTANDALSAQRDANRTARVGGADDVPFPAAKSAGSVSELAALPEAKQQEVLGGAKLEASRPAIEQFEKEQKAVETKATAEYQTGRAAAANEKVADLRSQQDGVRAHQQEAQAAHDAALTEACGQQSDPAVKEASRDLNRANNQVERADDKLARAERTAAERTNDALATQQDANRAAKRADPNAETPFPDADKLKGARDLATKAADDPALAQRVLGSSEASIEYAPTSATDMDATRALPAAIAQAKDARQAARDAHENGSPAEATAASRDAIAAQKDANAISRRASVSNTEGPPDELPFPAAERFGSATELARATPAEQRAVLGTSSRLSARETANAEEQIRTDITDVAARNVDSAASQGPAEGAAALRTEMERLQSDPMLKHDPALKAMLAEKAAPATARIAEDLLAQGGQDKNELYADTVSDLTQASEIAGQDAAAPLARAFASKMEDKDIDIDDKDRFGGALKQSIKDGDGALFGTLLTGELKAQGKTEAAGEVAKATNEAVSDLREDFSDAKEKWEERQGELATVQQQYGTMLTPEAYKAGLDEYMADHKDDFENFEDASAKMASTLEGLGHAYQHQDTFAGLGKSAGFDGGEVQTHGDELIGAARGTLEDLPTLGRSKAGSEAIRNALVTEGQAAGATGVEGRTFLDAANGYREAHPDDKEYGEQMELLKSTVASAAMGEQLQGGSPDDVAALQRGLGATSANKDLGRAYMDMADEIPELAASSRTPAELALQMAGTAESIAGKHRGVFKAEADDILAANRVKDASQLTGQARTDYEALAGRQQALTRGVIGVNAAIAVAGVASEPNIDSVLEAGSQVYDVGADVAELRQLQDPAARAGRLSAGLRVAGGVLAGGAVAKDLLDGGDFDGENAARTGLKFSTEAATAALKSFGKAGAGKLAPGVGVVVGGYDTVRSVVAGDSVGGAINGAMTGATVGAFFGPVGAGVGAVAGAALGAAGGALFDKPHEKFQNRTESFHRGVLEHMDVNDPEGGAKLLRENSPELKGAVESFGAVAGELGVSSYDLFRGVMNAPEETRDLYLKAARKLAGENDEIKEGDDVVGYELKEEAVQEMARAVEQAGFLPTRTGRRTADLRALEDFALSGTDDLGDIERLVLDAKYRG